MATLALRTRISFFSFCFHSSLVLLLLLLLLLLFIWTFSPRQQSLTNWLPFRTRFNAMQLRAIILWLGRASCSATTPIAATTTISSTSFVLFIISFKAVRKQSLVKCEFHFAQTLKAHGILKQLVFNSAKIRWRPRRGEAGRRWRRAQNDEQTNETKSCNGRCLNLVCSGTCSFMVWCRCSNMENGTKEEKTTTTNYLLGYCNFIFLGPWPNSLSAL